MTLAEFKAWLEGYRASFTDGVPNADQWAEIEKRIAKTKPLDASPTLYRDLPTTTYAPIWTRPASPTDPVPYWPVTC